MQFGVLGPLEVIADGRTVALPAAKHRALLVALLVRANQAAYGELAGAPFVRAVAARLEELRLAALEWRAEARLALGGHAELVGELEQLVEREPFRERLWAHLMLALYRSGRQAEALSAYRRLRDRLADQLGIDPGPELRRREERILRQDVSPDLATAQARPRDDRSRMPPVSAAPPQAPLVGRDAELGRLRRAWEEARTSTMWEWAAGPRLGGRSSAACTWPTRSPPAPGAPEA